MNAEITWRALAVQGDPERIADLCRATGFFSEEEVGIAAELASERLADGAASGYEFIFCEQGGKLLGYACYGGPIAGTQSSFDLYWIVVDPATQGRGLGRAIIHSAERAAAAMGCRRLYVETSTRAQYAPTRAFYAAVDYKHEATLEDFYGPGDGKAIFVKQLDAPNALA